MSTKVETPTIVTIPPVEIHVSGWRPMVFNAELQFGGLRWLRVMGSRRRDVWIAELDGVSISVYHLRASNKWQCVGSADKQTLSGAMTEAIDLAARQTQNEIEAVLDKIVLKQIALKTLRLAQL